MPAAYSLDLRTRVVACAQEEGLTHGALARRFRVGESTVRAWLRRARTTGTLAPRPPAGGPRPCVDAEAAAVLRDLVREDNAQTLAELAERLVERVNATRPPERTLRRLSVSGLCRVCQRLDLRRKKKERRPGRADA